MLGVTFFGLLLTPVFYVLIRRLAKRQPIEGGAGDAPARIASPETH
jgi:multidrug efflux pump